MSILYILFPLHIMDAYFSSLICFNFLFFFLSFRIEAVVSHSNWSFVVLDYINKINLTFYLVIRHFKHIIYYGFVTSVSEILICIIKFILTLLLALTTYKSFK